jgi:hypothetical protein
LNLGFRFKSWYAHLNLDEDTRMIYLFLWFYI